MSARSRANPWFRDPAPAAAIESLDAELRRRNLALTSLGPFIVMLDLMGKPRATWQPEVFVADA